MTAAVITPDMVATPIAKPKRLKLIIAVAVVLAALGGAGYWFLLKPAPSGPQPGAVAPLSSIQVNLADGHYLRLGIALQLTKDAGTVDGSKALDAAISLFSGESVARVESGPQREKLRTRLNHLLQQRYDGAVMNVYFTEFVTQ